MKLFFILVIAFAFLAVSYADPYVVTDTCQYKSSNSKWLTYRGDIVSANGKGDCDFPESADRALAGKSIKEVQTPARQVGRNTKKDEEDDEPETNQRFGGNHNGQGNQGNHYEQENHYEEEHHQPEPQHQEAPNLLANGGFRNNFQNWTFFNNDNNDAWRIQNSHNFYSDHNLPLPPTGRNAAMISSPDGIVGFSGLYQDFSTAQFDGCAIVRFDVSYYIYYRNDAPAFDVTGPTNSQQWLSVDIFSEANFLNIIAFSQNLFKTVVGSPQNTNNQYVQKTGTFFYSNGINDFNVDNFRFQVSLTAKDGRLRVGIDGVRITAKCVNFQ